ncbi:hypothetical protein AB0H82_17605 [Streptomyces sp. NPDC050732]|uniref:hypothetical protein n=1 Tax=Streptomyces sp. NPDC050732 TaxID=3154632 RepID=UPI00341F34A4
MSRREAIKAAVLEMIEEVVGEDRDGGPLPEIKDTDLLVDHLGLRSLHLARITAMLEVELDLDPFSELVPITSIRTVDDLYRAYDIAAEGGTAADFAPAPADAPTAAGMAAGRSAAQRVRALRSKARDQA